jgi:hypothetical protein
MGAKCNLQVTHPQTGETVKAILTKSSQYAVVVSFRGRRATDFVASLICHSDTNKYYVGTFLPNTKGSFHVALFTGLEGTAKPADYTVIISEKADDETIPKKAAVAVTFTVDTSTAQSGAGKRRLTPRDGSLLTIGFPQDNATVCTHFTANGSFMGDRTPSLSGSMSDGVNTVNGGGATWDSSTGVWTIPFDNVPDEVYTLTVTDSVSGVSAESKNVKVAASACDPPPPGGPPSP